MQKSLKPYRDAWKDILTYENHVMFLQERQEVMKMSVLHELIYTLNVISIRVPVGWISETEKPDLKTYVEKWDVFPRVTVVPLPVLWFHPIQVKLIFLKNQEDSTSFRKLSPPLSTLNS